MNQDRAIRRAIQLLQEGARVLRDVIRQRKLNEHNDWDVAGVSQEKWQTLSSREQKGYLEHARREHGPNGRASTPTGVPVVKRAVPTAVSPPTPLTPDGRPYTPVKSNRDTWGYR